MKSRLIVSWSKEFLACEKVNTKKTTSAYRPENKFIASHFYAVSCWWKISFKKAKKRERGGEKRKIAFTHTHTESTNKRHKIEGRELFTRRRRAKYHKNRPTDLRQLKEIEPLTFTSLSFYYEKHLLCNFLASKSTHINFYRRARKKRC